MTSSVQARVNRPTDAADAKPMHFIRPARRCQLSTLGFRRRRTTP